jgi:hypothetical protein
MFVYMKFAINYISHQIKLVWDVGWFVWCRAWSINQNIWQSEDEEHINLILSFFGVVSKFFYLALHLNFFGQLLKWESIFKTKIVALVVVKGAKCFNWWKTWSIIQIWKTCHMYRWRVYTHLSSSFVFALEFAWSIHVVNTKCKKVYPKLQASLPNVVLQA